MRTTTSMARGTESTNPEAFTFVELLVVLAVLALVFLTLLPALARTQPDSRAFQCLNNHRQLARAWRMYADDYSDRLAPNVHGSSAISPSPTLPYAPWTLVGWLTWATDTANTNAGYLTDQRYCALAPYCGKSARLFKCPADVYLSTVQRSRGWKERVRSVSENIFVGAGNAEEGPTDASWLHVKKWSELVNPKPEETWLFLDEHPDSINDGAFFAPRISYWIDMPANYHDGGAGVAFTDGHAEIHRWQASALSPRINYTTFAGLSAPANDPDIPWLRYHTPRKPGMN